MKIPRHYKTPCSACAGLEPHTALSGFNSLVIVCRGFINIGTYLQPKTLTQLQQATILPFSDSKEVNNLFVPSRKIYRIIIIIIIIIIINTCWDCSLDVQDFQPTDDLKLNCEEEELDDHPANMVIS